MNWKYSALSICNVFEPFICYLLRDVLCVLAGFFLLHFGVPVDTLFSSYNCCVSWVLVCTLNFSFLNRFMPFKHRYSFVAFICRLKISLELDFFVILLFPFLSIVVTYIWTVYISLLLPPVSVVQDGLFSDSRK